MKLSRILLLSASLLSFQAHAMDPIDDGRPNEHFCPITQQFMKNPVVAADGHSYEKEAILQWLSRGNTKSPITGLPLKNKDLLDNHALKIMIHEWKPGQQNAPSVLATKNAESIAGRVKEEFARNAVLLNAAKNKHIVAFLGNTGAGKSTLVNLLAGKKLIVSEDGQDYILENTKDSTAMVIGTSGNSETLYPKAIDVDGLRFFDLPGFNDTDGSERNLINAAFTRQILLDAASVRLVFVAGQDQFTADRSSSVKQMFHAIKQLFVTEQGTNLVDNGIFVATKMICSPQADLTDFLLKKTKATDKEELHAQLKTWSTSNKLCRVFHPVLEESNKGIRDNILSLIKAAKPTKIHGINVSVLYPSNTKAPLEKMFLNVLERAFERKMKSSLTTLSDYDRAITSYTSGNFWQTFDEEVSGEEKAIGLLKEFCNNPYKNAFGTLQKQNEKTRQTHIQHLQNKKQERIKNIEDRTKIKAQSVISTLVPKKKQDNLVSFDFAYHKDFHEAVCGSNSISHLATDLQEQEIVRSYYAGFISEHSHNQVMEWHQKFSGIDELSEQIAIQAKQIAAQEKKLKTITQTQDTFLQQIERTESNVYDLVTAPWVRWAEEEQRAWEAAEPERRRIQAQQAAEERRLAKIRRKIPNFPPIAYGYEEIYQRFFNGKLVYKPNSSNDVGKIELKIAKLNNPLEGTFDLSRCGDTGRFLSIATGYRKVQNPANGRKVEIWLTPRFLVDKEMPQLAPKHHIRAIIGDWNAARAPVGIFWTSGEWNAAEQMGYCEYLTSESMDEISSENLYEKNKKSRYYIGRTWVGSHLRPDNGGGILTFHF